MFERFVATIIVLQSLNIIVHPQLKLVFCTYKSMVTEILQKSCHDRPLIGKEVEVDLATFREHTHFYHTGKCGCIKVFSLVLLLGIERKLGRAYAEILAKTLQVYSMRKVFWLPTGQGYEMKRSKKDNNVFLKYT